MTNEEYLQRLGIKLKILRNIKKLSQDDIANELNIDKSYYSKVERGLTNPTIVYLRNLAQILEVELNELVDEHINIQPNKACPIGEYLKFFTNLNKNKNHANACHNMVFHGLKFPSSWYNMVSALSKF